MEEIVNGNEDDDEDGLDLINNDKDEQANINFQEGGDLEDDDDDLFEENVEENDLSCDCLSSKGGKGYGWKTTTTKF
jgi:hypothetical protein